MKIIYCGIQRTGYGPDARGQSFEQANLFRSLMALPGAQVIEHPFDTIVGTGRAAWNDALLHLVEQEKPDLVFAFMYTDEFERRTLRALNERTTTLAWFADDYWRFWNYARRWAPLFSWAVTTAPQAVAWYRRAGIKNVILSQWACNTADYGPRPEKKEIPVSFIGQYKSSRGTAIRALAWAGIHVEAFGRGWPNGPLDPEAMLRVIARSKINLNLNARPALFEPAVLARLFLRKSVGRLVPDVHLVQNTRAWWHFRLPHIHARPFEIAGCGAFVITGYAPHMEDYYRDGKEMVFYRTFDELVAKIRYYLAHDDEREAIARAGYERTVREHTYAARFREIFHRIGRAS
jgi:spore maturation protein CgeB